MRMNNTDDSYASLRTSRQKAIEMLPILRKRDEGGKLVRIDPRTVVIKKTETMKIKVFEAFAGYGSQMMALRRLSKHIPPNLEFELVGWSEIDYYAVQAHNAVWGDDKDKNFGDICKIDWSKVPYFDLFTYSFPCQSVSNAGLQKGLTEGSGTTSSLLWECKRAIIAKHPTFMLMENVANLVSKKFMPEFDKWLRFCKDEGYVNFWQKMNAKDYGVPQNRVRVFCVSIHRSAMKIYPTLFPERIHFQFPKAFPLEKRLKDVLETYHDGKQLNEKYYCEDGNNTQPPQVERRNHHQPQV